jgi:hypothetical protein
MELHHGQQHPFGFAEAAARIIELSGLAIVEVQSLHQKLNWSLFHMPHSVAHRLSASTSKAGAN